MSLWVTWSTGEKEVRVNVPLRDFASDHLAERLPRRLGHDQSPIGHDHVSLMLDLSRALARSVEDFCKEHSNYPSSVQIGRAILLARLLDLAIPPKALVDSEVMQRFIDENHNAASELSGPIPLGLTLQNAQERWQDPRVRG